MDMQVAVPIQLTVNRGDVGKKVEKDWVEMVEDTQESRSPALELVLLDCYGGCLVLW